MGRELRDKTTGARYYQDDDGKLHPAEKSEFMVQAARQVADIGSGIQAAYGGITDRPELVEAANEATQARNKTFYGTDQLDPWRSMLGQAIPGAATAPITGGSSMVGQLATSAALGAAESALDYGEAGTFGQRAAAGAAGGLLGEGAGRVMGRVYNTAKGLVNDIRLGRGRAANPKAAEFEEMGGSLLESQRAAQGTPEQRTLQRIEQGAEASMFSPGLQQAQDASNQALYRSRVLEAVGLPENSFDELGPEALQEANRRLSEGFSEIAGGAGGQGPIQISDELAGRIGNTRGQIKQLRERGRFQGLDSGVLSGTDWNVARRALASDAANAAARGEPELADDIFADVEELDRIMEGRLGSDFLEQFAKLREQYRVFKIVSKSGVIKPDGDVSIKNLNRALQAGTGFGTTAQQGLDTVNQASKELIDVARLGSNPDFQPFRSSGTAENLSAQRMAGMALDPTQWLSAAGEAAMPAAAGLTSSRGGRAVTGMLTPAPLQARAAGAGAGRSMLDELLYPFVGAEDERQP